MSQAPINQRRINVVAIMTATGSRLRRQMACAACNRELSDTADRGTIGICQCMAFRATGETILGRNHYIALALDHTGGRNGKRG